MLHPSHVEPEGIAAIAPVDHHVEVARHEPPHRFAPGRFERLTGHGTMEGGEGVDQDFEGEGWQSHSQNWRGALHCDARIENSSVCCSQSTAGILRPPRRSFRRCSGRPRRARGLPRPTLPCREIIHPPAHAAGPTLGGRLDAYHGLPALGCLQPSHKRGRVKDTQGQRDGPAREITILNPDIRTSGCRLERVNYAVGQVVVR